MRELLLDRCDAAGVLAANYICKSLRMMESFLLHNLAVLDDIDSDLIVDETNYIEIDLIQTAFDLNDIFLPHQLAGSILDDSYLIIDIAEMEISVKIHGLSGRDMIENNTVFNSADI